VKLATQHAGVGQGL